MKKILLVVLSLLVSTIAKAQLNMVPNGDFEAYTLCPIGISQLDRCTGWILGNAASTDYYNVCANPSGAGVPGNALGYQFPVSGNAYTGLIAFNLNVNYREYMKRTIIPLTPNVLYEVSMSVARANNCRYGSNGLGVLFFNQGYPAPAVPNGIIPVTPQVSYNNHGIISDTLSWTRVVNTFVADSAYDNILIGGFLPDVSIDTLRLQTTGSGYSYYYIDSVVIRTTKQIAILPFTDTMLCRGDVINVPFTFWGTFLAPGNIFTLQLSDATGSFANPANIGSIAGTTAGNITGTIPLSTAAGTGYRVRIKSSDAVDSSMPNSFNISIGNIIPVKPVVNATTILCSGNILNLTATTTTPGVTWHWVGPNSFSSATQNPSISSTTTAMTGDYIVEAAIYGCRSERDTVNISVIQTPITNATNNGPLCEGQQLQLNTANTVPGTTFSWSGPSYTSSAQNPIINNSAIVMSGTYTVIANNNGCTATSSTSAVIGTVPAKPVAMGNTPVCTGNSLNLTASTSATGVTWSWKGPAPFTSTLQNPSFTVGSATQSGNYIVEVILGICHSEKDTVAIVVNETPVAITASNNGPFCEPQQLMLSSTNSSAGVTWSWIGPLSYSSAQQNTVINNTNDDMSGNYTVTASKDGCSVSNTTTVTVKPTPIVSGFSNSPVCAGTSLNLTSSSTGTTAASYSWVGPVSFTATQPNVTLTGTTVAMAGTYTVTASFNGCATTATVPVTIHPVPVITSATNNGPLCVGMQLQLNALSSVPGGAYTWIGPNSFTSNQQNSSISNVSPANAGQYSVTATANGCTSQPATTTLVLHPEPYLGAYASPNDTVCENTVVSFVTVPMNGVVNPQFQWFRNTTPIQNATNIIHIGPYATGDSFYCRTYAQDVCSNNITLYSNKIGMIVNNLVTSLSASISSSPAQVTPGKPVSFAAAVISGGYTPKFQWKKNGVDVFGAVTSNWNANNLNPFDEITCFVTTSDTCASPKTTTSNKIVVNFPTVVNDLGNNSDIQLYPNPSNGSFKLSTHNLQIQKIEVLNMAGQVLYTQNISASTDETTFDLGGHFANGIYHLRITTHNGIVQKRLTLQR